MTITIWDQIGNTRRNFIKRSEVDDTVSEMKLPIISVIVFIIMTIIIIQFKLASAETITVDDDQEADYSTLQDAIENATKGDVIMVGPGTYRENLVINVTITIQGADRNETIIDGGENGDVLTILANDTNITGLSIMNSIHHNFKSTYFLAGLVIEADNCSIENCSFFSNGNGIYLNEASNNVIRNNYCYENFENIRSDGSGSGIVLSRSNENEILNNRCERNDGNGIDLQESDFNVIEKNTCSGNGWSGIVISSRYGENLIRNNSCISNDHDGISVEYWSGLNEIIENNCSKNENGIGLYRSDSCFISRNIVSGNWGNGILVFEAKENEIKNNYCENNANSGIQISYSFGIMIRDNTLIGNKFGVKLRFHDREGEYSEDENTNILENNTFHNNDNEIILVADESWFRANYYCLCFTSIIVFMVVVVLTIYFNVKGKFQYTLNNVQ